MSDLNLKEIWIPYEVLTNNTNTCPSKVPSPSPTKVQYPMEQKVKDNKYNINNYKNNNKRNGNFEQRDYEKEGFDLDSLYANNKFATKNVP